MELHIPFYMSILYSLPHFFLWKTLNCIANYYPLAQGLDPLQVGNHFICCRFFSVLKPCVGLLTKMTSTLEIQLKLHTLFCKSCKASSIHVLFPNGIDLNWHFWWMSWHCGLFIIGFLLYPLNVSGWFWEVFFAIRNETLQWEWHTICEFVSPYISLKLIFKFPYQ